MCAFNRLLPPLQPAALLPCEGSSPPQGLLSPTKKRGSSRRSWLGCAESSAPPSSSHGFVLSPPTLHCRCLLLPSVVTHFMTSRLRVTRLNTPRGRHGCAQGARQGSVLRGLGSPCSASSAWRRALGVPRAAPEPWGCKEPLVGARGEKDRAGNCQEPLVGVSRGKGKAGSCQERAQATGGSAQPAGLWGRTADGPGGTVLRKWK